MRKKKADMIWRAGNYANVYATFQNWEKEFQKWLGHERLNIFAASTENRPEVYVLYVLEFVCVYLHARAYLNVHVTSVSVHVVFHSYAMQTLGYVCLPFRISSSLLFILFC